VRFLYFGLIGVIFVVAGCAPRMAKPVKVENFTIFVSGYWKTEELPIVSEVVSRIKKERPCLWLIAGEVFDEKFAPLTDGAANIDLLSLAGVDGVLFSPGWLGFGVERVKQLTDRAKFRVLGYNLSDSFDLPLVHPWMIKRVAGINLAISGLFLDSVNVLLRLKGLKFVSPGYAGQKLLTLFKNKADLTAVLVLDSGAVSGFDVILDAPGERVLRYDFVLVNGKVQNVKKEVVSLEAGEPQPQVARTVDSLRMVLDSTGALPVVETRVKISPQVLSRAIVDGYLGLRAVDIFIYDSSNFVRDTIFPGTITRSKLMSTLSEPGRLALIELEGEEINRLLKGNRRLTMESRSGLRGRRIMARKRYRVATTIGVLQAIDAASVRDWELSLRQLWEYAADVLQAQGKR